jgi:hypothetical protein
MTSAPLPTTLDQAQAEIMRLRAQVAAQARTIWADTRIIAALRRELDKAQATREAAE